MRKYEEMVPEFSALSGFDDRQKWLYSLTIEELREFRGLNSTIYMFFDRKLHIEYFPILKIGLNLGNHI